MCYCDCCSWQDDDDDAELAASDAVQLNLPYPRPYDPLLAVYTPALQAMLNNSTLLLKRLRSGEKTWVQGATFTIPAHSPLQTS